ncbi:hypothetical protein PMG11_08619 [Penicillium brasilianum]|uniref:Uncharacterized protein n=1 Tax=Penicillium brasilianum TaxID=104259 RepID=A0A0F7TXD8_PENBI|nr:hypothetical protein PMG11_08619 [Penicillium brasilianum]
MRDVKCRIEGLESILQGLRDILTDAGRIDPPLAGKFKVALRMITDCESAIQELDGTSSKLQNGPSQAAQGDFPALKTASKRALYPFRRDALVGLLSVLDGLQENLDTALALLQMYAHSTPAV